MDPLVIYAIIAGSIFAGLVSLRTFSVLAIWRDWFSAFCSQHLLLPFVIRRHRLCGPWTRAGILLHVSYVAINIFLIFFRTETLANAGLRAGELALINLIFPLSAAHLSYLADLLGIKWRACCKIHRATGWMSVALLSFHLIMAAQIHGFTFPLRDLENLLTMLVCLFDSITRL
jgi:hypothetical protein